MIFLMLSSPGLGNNQQKNRPPRDPPNPWSNQLLTSYSFGDSAGAYSSFDAAGILGYKYFESGFQAQLRFDMSVNPNDSQATGLKFAKLFINPDEKRLAANSRLRYSVFGALPALSYLRDNLSMIALAGGSLGWRIQPPGTRRSLWDLHLSLVKYFHEYDTNTLGQQNRSYASLQAIKYYYKISPRFMSSVHIGYVLQADYANNMSFGVEYLIEGLYTFNKQSSVNLGVFSGDTAYRANADESDLQTLNFVSSIVYLGYKRSF